MLSAAHFFCHPRLTSENTLNHFAEVSGCGVPFRCRCDHSTCTFRGPCQLKTRVHDPVNFLHVLVHMQPSAAEFLCRGPHRLRRRIGLPCHSSLLPNKSSSPTKAQLFSWGGFECLIIRNPRVCYPPQKIKSFEKIT